jgi:SAM-dependent methyltransferase
MNVISMEILENFLTRFPRDKPLKILEVGSCIHGTDPRSLHFPPSWDYEGLDIKEGEGVDIVAKDPYKYPIEDNTYDLVISIWTMEHIENLWKWIEEIYRIVKVGGWVLLIAPTTGRVGHQYPDYWRICPDGMKALIKHGGFRNYNIGVRIGEDEWNPCIGEATK